MVGWSNAARNVVQSLAETMSVGARTHAHNGETHDGAKVNLSTCHHTRAHPLTSTPHTRPECCLLLRRTISPACCLSSPQGIPRLHKWSTIATTLAILCSVPLSDLPADRGVTYERRRHMRTKHGQHCTSRQVTTPLSYVRGGANVRRRATAIEHELYTRADAGAAGTELAATLQE
jgi:hypothetical protein